MRKFQDQNPLGFALTWIGAYVALFSWADQFSWKIGIEKIVTAPVSLAMMLFLLLWLRKEGKWVEFGITGGKYDQRAYLYFLPLWIMVSTNLWGGVELRFSAVETGLYVLSMICVGILEEILFRGFLFRALCRENLKQAVIVSSVTFGIGHIVNLLNGAELIPTLLQICYATAAGFLFTVIFMRSGSLMLGILTHCAVNSLSAVGAERSKSMDMLAAGMLTLVAAGYGIWILNHTSGGRERRGTDE